MKGIVTEKTNLNDSVTLPEFRDIVQVLMPLFGGNSTKAQIQQSKDEFNRDEEKTKTQIDTKFLDEDNLLDQKSSNLSEQGLFKSKISILLKKVDQSITNDQSSSKYKFQQKKQQLFRLFQKIYNFFSDIIKQNILQQHRKLQQLEISTSKNIQKYLELKKPIMNSTQFQEIKTQIAQLLIQLHSKSNTISQYKLPNLTQITNILDPLFDTTLTLSQKSKSYQNNNKIQITFLYSYHAADRKYRVYQISNNFTSKVQKIDYQFPFGASITQSGNVAFVSGGINDRQMNQMSMLRGDFISLDIRAKTKFMRFKNLTAPRHLHSMASNHNQQTGQFILMTTGGQTAKEEASRHCGRYDFKKNKWIDLKQMVFGRRSHACCLFGDQPDYLIVYCGSKNSKPTSDLSEIQRFSLKSRKWVTLKDQKNRFFPQQTKQFAAQINQKQILIYGGRDRDTYTVLLQPSAEQKKNTMSIRFLNLRGRLNDNYASEQSNPVDFYHFSVTSKGGGLWCIGANNRKRKEKDSIYSWNGDSQEFQQEVII